MNPEMLFFIFLEESNLWITQTYLDQYVAKYRYGQIYHVFSSLIVLFDKKEE
jgi:hypothetical protein